MGSTWRWFQLSELERFRDHCRERADWQPGESRAACKDRTAFGTPKPFDHANCGGYRCGCDCHAPTDADRDLFRRLADEIDDHLAPSDGTVLDLLQLALPSEGSDE